MACPQAASCVAGVFFTIPGDIDCDENIDNVDVDLSVTGLFCDPCAECDTDDANQDGLISTAADLLAIIRIRARPFPSPTPTLSPTPTSTPTPTVTPTVTITPTIATPTPTLTPTPTRTPACLEVPADLAVWFPADGNAADVQGESDDTGRDGALQNGAAYAPGEVGQAFSLSGSNQFIRVPDSPNHYPGASSFTVAAWFATSVNGGTIVIKYECGADCPAGANSLYELYVDDLGHAGGGIRDSDASVNGLFLASSSVVADGAFHHVALVRDLGTGTLALYVDGVLEQQSALNTGSDGTIKNDDGLPDDLFIGGQPNASAIFSGLIDEVQLFNRALAPAEIQAIVHAESRGQCQGGLATAACKSGVACMTGSPGICAQGHTTCPDGSSGPPVCEPDRSAIEEVCGSGADEDCDGETDEAGCRSDGAPAARDDFYRTRAGETLAVPASGVLANDSDPEGEPLQTRLVRGALAGNLTLNADGSFAYAPDPVGTGTRHHTVDLTRVQPPEVRVSSGCDCFLGKQNLTDGQFTYFWLPNNEDLSPFAELLFDPPVTVYALRYFTGNNSFTAGVLNLYDPAGTLLFTTGEVSLPPGTSPIPLIVDVAGSAGGPVAFVSRLRFESRGAFEPNRGVREIQVLGDGAVPASATPAEVNLPEILPVQLNVSGSLGDFSRPEAANDGSEDTAWFNSSAALGFYELVFPVDVTATRINVLISDQGGITIPENCFGKYQLFDANGAVLFDTGEVNSPAGPERGTGQEFPLPNVSGVRRLRYTQTQICPASGGTSPLGFRSFGLFGPLPAGTPRLDMFERYETALPGEVHSTPLVANLTDSNGDGRIDRLDVPNVVAIMEGPGTQITGTMKVLSGNDGRELFTVGTPNLVSPWAEAAIGDLDGDGVPEIVAVHGDGNHIVAFESFRDVVRGNLSILNTPVTFNVSSSDPGGLDGTGPSAAVDGRLNTSWFTDRHDTVNEGSHPFFEMVFPRDATVSELRMFGNREYPDSADIRAGRFELFASDDTPLFDSGVVGLPSPDRDVGVAVPNVAQVRRVRFTPTDDEGSWDGFSELEVIGSTTIPGTSGYQARWVSDAHPQSRFFIGGTPVVTGAVAIANLDAAGTPEIIVGASVYDANGKLLGDGASLSGTTGGGTPAGGPKRSAISVVSDLDLDGVPELVAGPTAYQLRNDQLVKVWQRQDRTDGFAGIGNFDSDPEAEIVIVADGQVYMLNHDGRDAEVWNPPSHAPIALPGGGAGGAPTIGDFDGDGIPEIGIAGLFAYVALKRDGSILWKTAVTDYSSHSTGSTVFDFDQDGEVEVLYRDELYLRIYRGKDGLLLARTPLLSPTWTEEPVVADVDGDGDAEIVVCGHRSQGTNPFTPRGIFVFEDTGGGWAPTRRIWNQHSYHITNVNEDATIPLTETSNWLSPGLDNFRLNTFAPNDLRDFDDTFTYHASDGALDSAEATVRIRIHANRAPVIISTPPTSAFARIRYRYGVQVADLDPGESLTFSIPVAPAGMTIDPSSGLVGWTPSLDQIGEHDVTVRVIDGAENVALQKYVVTVSLPDPRDVDDDGDGLSEKQGDCDDTDPHVRPGIADPFGDGTDQDCDGADGLLSHSVDDDGDGVTENQGDCNDADAAVHPGAVDPFGDGIDQDCDGGDGIAANAADDDGDGFNENQGDCDDADPFMNPGATDVPGDGIDQNCNGADSVAGDDTPPTATIDSPADLAEVTAPTDIIGTADDASFLRYTLEIASVDSDTFTTLASATAPVHNGVLGRLDPTLLENGVYTLRLTAEDENGLTSTAEVAYHVSKEMKVGNLRLSFIDLSIPVSGIPISIVRTYDSRVKSKEAFGIGWTLDIARGLYQNNRAPGQGWQILPGNLGFPCARVDERQSHTTEVRLSDREFYSFAATLSRPTRLGGGCEAIAGFRFVDGSTPGATLESLDGTQVLYVNGDDKVVDPETFLVYDPQRVRLTTADGRTIDLVRRGGIARIADPNGNELSITADGITHSSGKSVSFSRDAQGRIQRITDPAGHTLLYAYDGNGNLSRFTDQDLNETTFTYDGRHNLIDIMDPLGNRAARGEYGPDGRLTGVIDPSGNRLTFSHDLGLRQETVTDRLGNTFVVQYDEHGNVVRRTDPLGNVTSLTYDVRDNKLSETDPLGNTRTYTYDANDNLLSEQDPLGNTTTYAYNRRNQELARTDALGGRTSSIYDLSGNLIGQTDPVGRSTNFTHDDHGNVASMTDRAGNTWTYSTDASGNRTRTTDPLGTSLDRVFDANGNTLFETTTRVINGSPEAVSRSYRYDAFNRVIASTDAEGGIREWAYTAIGRPARTTDALGRTTVNSYDDQGRLTGVTYPDGVAETYEYDAEGRVVSFTDRGGRVTIVTYDASGRHMATHYADGTSVRAEYDPAGRLVARTDENGHTWTFAYDDAGRLTAMRNPLGEMIAYGYDADGRRISQTDADGGTTTFAYDLAGRNTGTTFPNGTSTAATYDGMGRPLAVTDQEGNTTRYEYDAVGNLRAVVDALGGRTEYAYDDLRFRIRQTNALGSSTSLTEDRLGRPIRKRLAGGELQTWVYDSVGNLARRTDFNGQTTTFAYDAMNRLVKRTLPDDEIHEFSYTPIGKLATMIDGYGQTTFEYDKRDRPTLVREPDSREIRYEYDAVGNRLRLDTPAGSTEYTYDDANRLTGVDAGGVGHATLGYDRRGNLTALTYPNGIEAALSYDSVNRLTGATYKAGISTIASYAYALGAAGQTLQVVESPGRRVDYTYDALLRLIGERTTPDGGASVSTSYAYDAAGNRLTKTDDAGTIHYTYDVDDRMLTAGSSSFSYDANGNLLAENVDGTTRTHQYDALNRLRQVTAGSDITQYTYDALGNRVRKSDPSSTTTDFLVDRFGHGGTRLSIESGCCGSRPFLPQLPTDARPEPGRIGLPQVLAETDSPSGAFAEYTRGGDRLLSQKRPAGSTFYLTDAQRSARLLTDESGGVSDRYDYDAFGSLTSQAGAGTPNVYLFNGEQFDPSLEFYYLRARYYAPEQGRFISRDPFPGRPSDPTTLHPYVYVGNNPVNLADPTGLDWNLSSVMTAVANVGVLVTRAVIVPLANLYTTRVVVFGTAAAGLQRVWAAILPRTPAIVNGGRAVAQAAAREGDAFVEETEELAVVYGDRLRLFGGSAVSRTLDGVRGLWYSGGRAYDFMRQRFVADLGADDALQVACEAYFLLNNAAGAASRQLFQLIGDSPPQFGFDLERLLDETTNHGQSCLFLNGLEAD